MLYLSDPYPSRIYQKWFCLFKIANKKKSKKLYKKCLSFLPLSSSPFLKFFNIIEDDEEYKINLLINALYINPKDEIAYNYLYNIVKKCNCLDLLKNSNVYFKKYEIKSEFSININESNKKEIENLDIFLSEHSLYSISLKLFYSTQRPGKILYKLRNGKIDIHKENENELLDFILDKNNNLILGSLHKLLSNLGSFVHGAGRIRISDNKIIYIDNYSGHYRPTLSEFYFTLFLMDKIGFDLSKCYAINFEPYVEKEFVHKRNYINYFYKKLKLY